MSLQEEQARQAAAAAASGSGPTPSEANASSTAAAARSEPVPEGVSTQISDPTGGASIPANADVPPPTAVKVEDVELAEDDMLTGEEDLDEDEELRRALLLSQGGEEGGHDDDDVDMMGEGDLEGDDDEDEDIARASECSPFACFHAVPQTIVLTFCANRAFVS